MENRMDNRVESSMKNSDKICMDTGARMRRKFPFWTIGLVVGILLLAAGLWQDQFADIYRKAVMICMECIGIG